MTGAWGQEKAAGRTLTSRRTIIYQAALAQVLLGARFVPPCSLYRAGL